VAFEGNGNQCFNRERERKQIKYQRIKEQKKHGKE
jgi:hypothetical protein